MGSSSQKRKSKSKSKSTPSKGSEAADDESLPGSPKSSTSGVPKVELPPLTSTLELPEAPVFYPTPAEFADPMRCAVH